MFRPNSRRVIDATPNRVTPGRWDRKGLWGEARSRWIRALGPTDQVVGWYEPYVRKVYPAEFGLRAVTMITEQKLSVAEVARRLGVSENRLDHGGGAKADGGEHRRRSPG